MARFKCGSCEKEFSRKDSLKRHIRNIHEKITVSCTKCNRTFSRESLRKQHDIVCDGVANTSASEGGVCDVCGQFFARMGNLRQHKQGVHENTKYECRKCKKQYSRNCDRVKHEATCAPVTSSYVCAHCPATFKTIDELGAHGRQHQRKREATETADGPSAKRQKATTFNADGVRPVSRISGNYTPIKWRYTSKLEMVSFNRSPGEPIRRLGKRKTGTLTGKFICVIRLLALGRCLTSDANSLWATIVTFKFVSLKGYSEWT